MTRHSTKHFKIEQQQRYISLLGCLFGKKGFREVAQVHISQDGSSFKGLYHELINNIID